MTQSRLQALSAFVVAFVSVALSLSSVHAASVISTGSGNWNDGGNWSPAAPASPASLIIL